MTFRGRRLQGFADSRLRVLLTESTLGVPGLAVHGFGMQGFSIGVTMSSESYMTSSLHDLEGSAVYDR